MMNVVFSLQDHCHHHLVLQHWLLDEIELESAHDIPM